MLSGTSPTLSVPEPAFVTSTSAPAESTYRFPITFPSANFGSSTASVAASAPSSRIGTPPARRSSRPSPLLTTMISVSHTWLFSRVPVLIMIVPSVSARGLPASQFVNEIAAQHLSGRCGRQFIAEHHPIGCPGAAQGVADVGAQFFWIRISALGRNHHRDDDLTPLRVLDPDDRDVAHRRMLDEDVFHLGGGDVLAAADDGVV